MANGLIEAADGGDLQRVQALVAQGADLEVTDENGNSALGWAAYSAHPDVAQCLIDAGANIENSDNGANTPLIWAADAGETAVVSYLIDEGVDVNVQGLVGNTALARACRHGHRKIVQALLAVPDIDPNKANDKLQYPLHHAAYREHSEASCVSD